MPRRIFPHPINHELLTELLLYDPERGIFRWLKRWDRRCNRYKVGDIAGESISGLGYRYIKILGRSYRANRLAFFYVNERWPEGEVDHINRDRSDDRIANLREVSKSVNLHNRIAALPSSTTGLLGVTRNRKRFQATIKINGRRTSLGGFATPEEAHRAYVEGKARLIGMPEVPLPTPPSNPATPADQGK